MCACHTNRYINTSIHLNVYAYVSQSNARTICDPTIVSSNLLTGFCVTNLDTSWCAIASVTHQHNYNYSWYQPRLGMKNLCAALAAAVEK